jgi:hypothetical protein
MTKDRKIQWSSNSWKGNVNLTLLSWYPAMLLTFLFAIYFLSMPTSRAILFSFLFYSAPSALQFPFRRLVVLLRLAFLPVPNLSFSCTLFILVRSFFRPHPQYFLFVPCLCSVTSSVPTSSFSSHCFITVVLNFFVPWTTLRVW